MHLTEIYKTIFRVYNGHYKYLVLSFGLCNGSSIFQVSTLVIPFGLCNAPSTFQVIANSIFRPYLYKFILVFIDDILIYNPNWTMHLDHVQKALKIFKQH